MAIEVPFGKKVRVAFGFKDAAGNPALVDGLPTVATTLGVVVETVAAGGGFSTLVDPQGVGLGSITGTVDVDLGEGVKTLGFSLGDFNALASTEAVAVDVTSTVTE